MKKFTKALSCFCAAAILTAGAMATAQAAAPGSLSVMWGPVTKESTGDSLVLNMDNQSGSYKGEILISVSEDTKLIDAVSGLPVSFSDIADDETAYAYIGPAVTMSLPPRTHADLVLCNVPAGSKVPAYVEVMTFSWNADQTQATLTTTEDETYTVPAGCSVSPYRTRNIVTLDDLTAGSVCLIWSDDANTASSILLFAEDTEETAAETIKTGWQKIDGHWYLYSDAGSLLTGWQLVDGKWYYMDPETAVMQTGFLKWNGNFYYLQADGSMLTEPMTFTPDASGALH